MLYLELRRFIHRNLAARNILVNDQHNTFKIGDFCLARDFNLKPETDYSGNDAIQQLLFSISSLREHIPIVSRSLSKLWPTVFSLSWSK